VSQSDIAVLSPAILPEKPARPIIFLNLVLSIFVGTILGLGFSLLAETLDRKVRSRNDVADTLGVPVFVVSARKQTKKGLQLLNIFTKKSVSAS
jgi:capsular polysaccharide biosynthesis protein